MMKGFLFLERLGMRWLGLIRCLGIAYDKDV